MAEDGAAAKAQEHWYHKVAPFEAQVREIRALAAGVACTCA